MATSTLRYLSTLIYRHDFDDISELEGYLNSTIAHANFTPAGTARANLPFAGTGLVMIYGVTDNIRVLCFRANGDLYTRNQTNGTWESEWEKVRTTHINTVTGTTGNLGELNLNLSTSTYIILGAVCTSVGNVLCIPYKSGTANAVVLLNLTDLSQLKNTSVTVEVYYALR